MTIAERITLIRAGYKIGEIREMEAKEAERHEPEKVEPVNGMEPQPVGGTETQPQAEPEAGEKPQEPGADPDPRDREIEQLKQQLAAAQRQNINGNKADPYGMDDYIKDAFARK